jgi:hypothetical protein
VDERGAVEADLAGTAEFRPVVADQIGQMKDTGPEVLDDETWVENLNLVNTDPCPDRRGGPLDPPFVAVVPSPVCHEFTFVG